MLSNDNVQHIPMLDLGHNVQCSDDPMVYFRDNSDFFAQIKEDMSLLLVLCLTFLVRNK